jgi:DNA polymerase elongation subunit (family B)
MGIETLVGRIQNRDKYDNQWGLNDLKQLNHDMKLKIERVSTDRRVQEIEMSVGDVIEFVETKNMVISANGTMFRTDKDSIIVEILNDWFDKRKDFKNKMKQAYKSGDKELGEFYNKRQHAMKIKLNDVYGVFAQNGWRYSDGNLFISKAITLTGQRLDQESITFVNKEINSELGTNKDYVVTADTDSLFFEMKDLIKHRKPDVDIKSREQVVPVALEITAEYQEKTIQFLQNLCKSQFNCDNVYFELKQEVILERGLFTGKRRYAQFIVNKEGVPTEELDIKGMDIMKSNMTPLYAKFGGELLMDIMYGKPKKDIDKKIQDFRKYLKTVSYRDLAKPTGVKKISEYIANPPASGQIFSKLGNKCPINTKASIYHNDLLRFKQLDKQYSCITEGDKIKFIPLRKNPYSIEVLAFTNDSPPFIFEFLDKYADTDSGFENVLLNKLQNLYTDLNWRFPSLNENVSKFFSFG